MSRRRGEFEHRTSIFEGAYRAWSSFGRNVKLSDLEKSQSVSDLASPLSEDFYEYEALPRSGLRHPFIPSVLSYWLGKDAKKYETAQGLQTLRTWWQHRRKGESNTAKELLGTDEMKEVVKKYTLTFYDLIYSMVKLEKGTPPPTLAKQLKEVEMEHEEKKRKRMQLFMDEKIQSLASNARLAHLTITSLTQPAQPAPKVPSLPPLEIEKNTNSSTLESLELPKLAGADVSQLNSMMPMNGYPYQNNPCMPSHQQPHIPYVTTGFTEPGFNISNKPYDHSYIPSSSIDYGYGSFITPTQNDYLEPPAKVSRKSSSPFSSRSSSSSSIDETDLQNNVGIVDTDLVQQQIVDMDGLESEVDKENEAREKEENELFERSMSFLSQLSIDWENMGESRAIQAIATATGNTEEECAFLHQDEKTSYPATAIKTVSLSNHETRRTLFPPTA